MIALDYIHILIATAKLQKKGKREKELVKFNHFGQKLEASQGLHFSHWDRYLGMMTAMTQVPMTTMTTLRTSHPRSLHSLSDCTCKNTKRFRLKKDFTYFS